MYSPVKPSKIPADIAAKGEFYARLWQIEGELSVSAHSIGTSGGTKFKAEDDPNCDWYWHGSHKDYSVEIWDLYLPYQWDSVSLGRAKSSRISKKQDSYTCTLNCDYEEPYFYSYAYYTERDKPYSKEQEEICQRKFDSHSPVFRRNCFLMGCTFDYTMTEKMEWLLSGRENGLIYELPIPNQTSP